VVRLPPDRRPRNERHLAPFRDPFAGRGAAYLAHPVLGPRLRECTSALLAHAGASVEAILGPVDAMKLRSSMTLFEQSGEEGDSFASCLETFFGGRRDEETLRLLGRQPMA
jgi:uncharacterized protein (DUF1810 family)